MIKPKGKAEIGVSCFGQMCLDGMGATFSADLALAMSKAWERAEAAILNREYGRISVIDEDGDEVLYIGLDYKNIPFNMKCGLPLLAAFAPEKRKAKR